MFQRYVAIGDSTTEGLDDPSPAGGFRGWADRLAEKLADLEPSFRYANLAVRGLTTRQIHQTQLARALELEPDLATLVAGTNDVLRPTFDPEGVGESLEAMSTALRRAGATVLTFTLPDLTPVMPLARVLRGRVLKLNEQTRRIAGATGAVLVDLARFPVASDPRLWSDDRLHANSLGHERIAEALAHGLGLPGSSDAWMRPLPSRPPRRLTELARAEWAWTRIHFAPWVVRHLRGGSSSAGRVAKRPDLQPVSPRPSS